MTTIQSKPASMVRQSVLPILLALAIPVGLMINHQVPTGDWHTGGQVMAILALTGLIIVGFYRISPWLGDKFRNYNIRMLERRIKQHEKRPTARQIAYREADEANRRKQSRNNQ